MEDFFFRIRNFNGQLITSGLLSDNLFDISGQPTGLYFIEIFNENQLNVVKFLLK
jgi:hypothetical protein